MSLLPLGPSNKENRPPRPLPSTHKRILSNKGPVIRTAFGRTVSQHHLRPQHHRPAKTCLPLRNTKPGKPGLGRRREVPWPPVTRAKATEEVASPIKMAASKPNTFEPFAFELNPNKINDPKISLDELLAVVGRFPRRLYRPDLPPQTYMRICDDHIPVDFVRDRVDPILNKFLIAGFMHKVYPSVPSPNPEGPQPMRLSAPGEAHSYSFAVGVPRIVEGTDDGHLARMIAGYEPDICLAVRRHNDPQFQSFPITHLVYAMRCRHFPSLPVQPTSDRFLDSLLEVEDDDSWATEDDSMSTLSVDSDDHSDVSSESAASSIAPFDTGVYRHLPVVALTVPSPETFLILHNRLHAPGLKWQPELLALTDAQAHSPTTAQMALHALPLSELLRRIHRVYGIWANMQALGVDDDDSWEQVNSAWKVLSHVFRERM